MVTLTNLRQRRRGPLGVIHVEPSSSSLQVLSRSTAISWRLDNHSSNKSDHCPPVSSVISSSDDTPSPSSSHPDNDDYNDEHYHDDHDDNEEDEEEDDKKKKNRTSSSDEVSLLKASSDDDTDDDDDDDDSSVDSNGTGMGRIQYQFQKRGRLLSKVTHGKSKSYHRMILAREMASREQTLRLYKSKDSQLFTNHELPPPTPWTLRSIYQHLHKEVLFEVHHSLEAVWIATWYCLCHLSFFMIIDLFRRVVVTHPPWEISEPMIDTVFVVGGLTMMRMNGYLWKWLGQDSYRVVKFDVHNRRILNHWDTKILAWFRQRQPLQDAVSMMGFYMLYLGITHFYERIWIHCEQWIWAGYRYWEAQVVGLDVVACSQDEQFISVGVVNDTRASMTMNHVETCDALLHDQRNWLGMGYVFKFWCHQFTNKDLWLVCILFDTIVVVMASLALAVFGGSLFED